MFVRIRGKGACPENSQAAAMSIRGFRHTHSPPPLDSYYSVLLLPPSLTSTSTDAATKTDKPAGPPTTAAEPFRFALFPVGIQAATPAAAQAQYMSLSMAAISSAKANDGATTTAPLSPPVTLDSEANRMLWKETWNLYDILYDEVPLLPWIETTDDGVAAALVETVERELCKLALSDVASPMTTELHSLTSLADKTDGFKLASACTGSRQVVVCAHYYSSAPLSENLFHGVEGRRASNAAEPRSAASPVSMEGPVVVLDLADLPAAQAGGKAMVNVAWYTAFAAMQPDSALLRCRAVVVRLPYTSVPTYTQACRHCALSTSSAGAAPTMADAFREAVDFIGEHVAAVYQGMVLALQAASPELAAKCTAAPPVVVIGSMPAALSSCLGFLLETPVASTTEKFNSANVVVIYGDHLGPMDTGSAGASDPHSAVEARSAHMVGQYKSIGGTCGFPVDFEMVLVPLKALLDGGEEPWDEYTLRERARLNFCPCCGDCSNNNNNKGCSNKHDHGLGHCGSH
ncbi:hypothetical protein, conserved [Leishmania lindenbergi]|uniref:Uncharacterized protein n=1 Tax=Leishmania lindenbergi TaxID=651832 RepID=A0AAW3AV62_9TRYP